MYARVSSPYARGAIYGLAAVCIWASFIVVSRLGVTTSMTPWDVAAIRFTVAGLLLLPCLVRKGTALDRPGWTGVGAIVGRSVRPRVPTGSGRALLIAPAKPVRSAAGGCGSQSSWAGADLALSGQQRHTT